MASFMPAFLVFVSLLTLLEGVSIVRDDVDTIVVDESDWDICPPEAPIAGRDFRLTKAQGCFNGQGITGTEDPRVIVVYESRNVSVDSSITATLVYNSFGMNWIAASSFPRYGRLLLVSLSAYTKGKLFAIGNGTYWTLIKVYGYDAVRPTVFPFTTLTSTSTTLISTSYVSSTRAITRHTSTMISTRSLHTTTTIAMRSSSHPTTQSLTTKNPFTKLWSTTRAQNLTRSTDLDDLRCFFYENAEFDYSEKLADNVNKESSNV